MNYNYKITKKYMDKLEAKIKEQQERINKAIEFVEKNYLFEIDKTDKKLLDILKGSDSNER